MKTAIYPGSFDPITNGHLNILERALGIFERVTVLIAINPQKTTLFSLQESIDMVSEVTSAWPQVSVDYNDGLTVDYARRHNIRTAVRGLRAVTDFEHEFSMALTNRSLWPEFDTVFLMTRVDYMYLSSSVVRQVAQAAGGHATLVRAPDGLKADVPVFHPQPAGRAALSRRVREGFDPRGILNPGRMGGPGWGET